MAAMVVEVALDLSIVPLKALHLLVDSCGAMAYNLARQNTVTSMALSLCEGGGSCR